MLTSVVLFESPILKSIQIAFASVSILWRKAQRSSNWLKILVNSTSLSSIAFQCRYLKAVFFSGMRVNLESALGLATESENYADAISQTAVRNNLQASKMSFLRRKFYSPCIQGKKTEKITDAAKVLEY